MSGREKAVHVAVFQSLRGCRTATGAGEMDGFSPSHLPCPVLNSLFVC